MGQISNKRIAIALVFLLLTGFVAYGIPSSKAVKPAEPLSRALQKIDGWKYHGSSPLDPKIAQALELDDYIDAAYSNGSKRVFLYIGYYFSNKKIGAAHDPLVCFPGQGWTISQRKTGSVPSPAGANKSVDYSSMIVERGQHREMIVYWFQSYDKANPDTLGQKLTGILHRLVHQKEANAFVRISLPLEGRSPAESLEIAHDFMRDFYPVFLNYIRS